MTAETPYELVERVRKEHNGVFSVELHFGHDGNNVCRYRNYEQGAKGDIAEGCSGRSMEEAIQVCHQTWLESHLDLEQVCRTAAAAFAAATAAEHGVFNTTSFESALPTLLRPKARQLLINCDRVVRLAGGGHWMLIPGGARRYTKDVTIPEVQASGPV